MISWQTDLVKLDSLRSSFSPMPYPENCMVRLLSSMMGFLYLLNQTSTLNPPPLLFHLSFMILLILYIPISTIFSLCVCRNLASCDFPSFPDINKRVLILAIPFLKPPSYGVNLHHIKQRRLCYTFLLNVSMMRFF